MAEDSIHRVLWSQQVCKNVVKLIPAFHHADIGMQHRCTCAQHAVSESGASRSFELDPHSLVGLGLRVGWAWHPRAVQVAVL